MSSEENYALVEGQWNNFTFRRILPADHAKVLEHVTTYFLREEPTCQLLGFTEAFAQEMCTVLTEMLKDNLSFLAEETASKQIAAVRITYRQTKAGRFKDLVIQEPQTQVFWTSIDWSDQQKQETMTTAGVEEYAELFISSTHPGHRKQGISTELYTRSLKFLKAEGIKLVKCIFTSPIARRAAVKLEFKEVSRVYYNTVVDKAGTPMFSPDQLTEEHFASAMIKNLD